MLVKKLISKTNYVYTIFVNIIHVRSTSKISEYHLNYNHQSSLQSRLFYEHALQTILAVSFLLMDQLS